jgi:hypothetical protein
MVHEMKCRVQSATGLNRRETGGKMTTYVRHGDNYRLLPVFLRAGVAVTVLIDARKNKSVLGEKWRGREKREIKLK